MTETSTRYTVTRHCCLSGQCVTCRGPLGFGRKPIRIVHASNVSEDIAHKMMAGWRDYAPKMKSHTCDRCGGYREDLTVSCGCFDNNCQ